MSRRTVLGGAILVLTYLYGIDHGRCSPNVHPTVPHVPDRRHHCRRFLYFPHQTDCYVFPRSPRPTLPGMGPRARRPSTIPATHATPSYLAQPAGLPLGPPSQTIQATVGPNPSLSLPHPTIQVSYTRRLSSRPRTRKEKPNALPTVRVLHRRRNGTLDKQTLPTCPEGHVAHHTRLPLLCTTPPPDTDVSCLRGHS